MVFLLIFLLFIFSCGGGGDSTSLQLRFSSSEPYYTGVWLRVSGKDFEPIFLQRSGVFYPGDRVVFELQIPQGKERHIEAVVLDPRGRPAFYGRKTTDLQGGVVVMDMEESFLKVRLEETFLDGSLPLEGRPLYLFSEDLYSLNYSNSVELFWVGSYLAYQDSLGWRFNYLLAPGEYRFGYSRLYELSLFVPEEERSLELYGSYVGEIKKEDKYVRISSERLLSGGRPLLVGLGKRLYFYHEGSFKPACGLFECRPINLSVSSPDLRTYKIFIRPYGLEVPVQEGEKFVVLLDIPYWLRLEGSVKTPCRMDYMLWVNLGNGFLGEAKIEVKSKRIRLNGANPDAHISIYSENFQMGGHCESSAKDGLLVPYMEDEDLWVEASYPDGLSVGALLKRGQEAINLPKVDLKVDMELVGDVLTMSFKRLGFFGWCSLELLGEKRIHIDRIPPWRSYIRLKGYFEEVPEYRIRCEWEDGYVERRSVKSFEIF